jgi:hypothetical protein
MEKNEIKKFLYKQNPKATFDYIRKGVAYYRTTIRINGENELPQSLQVFFQIPTHDMGDADFFSEMDSKLLNRWIV